MMISFNVNQTYIFILFIFYLLAAHYVWGARVRISSGPRVVENSRNIKPLHYKSESNEGQDLNRHSYHGTLDHLPGSSLNTLHPDLIYDSSQSSTSFHSEEQSNHYDKYTSTYDLELESIFPSLEGNDLSESINIHPRIPDISNDITIKDSNSPHSELSAVLDELFDNGLLTSDSMYYKISSDTFLEPKEESIKINPSSVIDIPADPNLKMQLMEGSGIEMNKYFLDSLGIIYQYDPRSLIRKLIEELIPPEELVTMHATNYRGYKTVPKKIADAVEDYVGRVSKPKLNHHNFIVTLRNHLKNIRRRYGVKKAELSNEPNEIEGNSFEDLKSMVELEDGKGVKIKKEMKEFLENRYKKSPAKLMRKLLSELIPLEELATMQVTTRNAFKPLPQNILESVKAFVNRVTETNMKDIQFTHIISRYLCYLRKAQNVNKVKLYEDTNAIHKTKVELMDGSGIMIRKNKLETLVNQFQKRPTILMRKLLSELIHPKELATMQATNRSGFKAIPENISKAVEDFIGLAAEPKISHSAFMNNVSRYLFNLRNRYKSFKKYEGNQNP